MENTLQLLTGQQAAKWLNMNYRTFMKEVLKGNIGYKIVGSVRRYPLKALEQWLNNTTYHSDYTSEAKFTTLTSRSLPPMEPELTFAQLRDKYFPKKRRNGALNTSKN
jgi:hypothetical protein